MLFAVASASYAPRAPLPRMMAAPAAGVDLDKVYRRAEFWEKDSTTLLEIVNVLGRWQKAEQWCERTEFAVVESACRENMRQGASVERFDYAKRNGYVERVALVQKFIDGTLRPLGSQTGIPLADLQNASLGMMQAPMRAAYSSGPLTSSPLFLSAIVCVHQMALDPGRQGSAGSGSAQGAPTTAGEFLHHAVNLLLSRVDEGDRAVLSDGAGVVVGAASFTGLGSSTSTAAFTPRAASAFRPRHRLA